VEFFVASGAAGGLVPAELLSALEIESDFLRDFVLGNAEFTPTSPATNRNLLVFRSLAIQNSFATTVQNLQRTEQ
jgi:hypothetical protein